MFTIPLAKKIEEEKMAENKSRFSIEPLYPGYGLTVSNALRRVLLSSLPGAGIEAVKIKGVDHEFSAIDWIKEDVVDILLNLKQVRIKVAPEILNQAKETNETIKLVLIAKGEKEIKAGDFDKSSGVEICNPDLHLLTMTDKAANLEMEIFVGYGLGYSAVESRDHSKENYEVGVIPIDAIYTSIKRVGYEIENVRVGDMTNWDKVLLDIQTDGSVTPKEAFDQAVEILVSQFGALRQEQTSTIEAPVKKRNSKKTKEV